MLDTPTIVTDVAVLTLHYFFHRAPLGGRTNSVNVIVEPLPIGLGLNNCIRVDPWKIINQISGAKNKKGVEKIELDNGETISDPAAVAQEISKYFHNIHSNSDNEIGQLQLASRVNSFFVSPTTAHESVVLLLSKDSYFAGLNNIHVFVCVALPRYLKLWQCNSSYLRAGNCSLLETCNYHTPSTRWRPYYRANRNHLGINLSSPLSLRKNLVVLALYQYSRPSPLSEADNIANPRGGVANWRPTRGPLC
ncbi:hypothetical protein J6590_105996 [Homalodisca vitripennis]|nr:hypothetical protein J6590_105996 [Homalodisca vitripennis]